MSTSIKFWKGVAPWPALVEIANEKGAFDYCRQLVITVTLILILALSLTVPSILL